MTVRTGDGSTDRERLLFGAGFVFGVMATLVILAVVLVGASGGAVAGDGLTAVPVLATVGGGVVFAAIVGTSLYYLAIPGNGARIPVDPGLFGFDDEEE